MSESKKYNGIFGYQPQKENRGFQPQGGYQPTKSISPEPPNKGSNVQPEKKDK